MAEANVINYLADVATAVSVFVVGTGIIIQFYQNRRHSRLEHTFNFIINKSSMYSPEKVREKKGEKLDGSDIDDDVRNALTYFDLVCSGIRHGALDKHFILANYAFVMCEYRQSFKDYIKGRREKTGQPLYMDFEYIVDEEILPNKSKYNIANEL